LIFRVKTRKHYFQPISLYKYRPNPLVHGL